MLTCGNPDPREPALCRRKGWGARSGFTLIELLGFVVMLFCVLAGREIAGHVSGGRYARLVGGLVGFVAFVVGGLMLALLKDLWSGGGLPACRNGCCRGPGNFRGHGDYTHGRIGDEYHYVCRCGDRYRRHGRRFVIVNDDGTELPYLIWRPFRGWYPDSSTGFGPGEKS